MHHKKQYNQGILNHQQQNTSTFSRKRSFRSLLIAQRSQNTKLKRQSKPLQNFSRFPSQSTLDLYYKFIKGNLDNNNDHQLMAQQETSQILYHSSDNQQWLPQNHKKKKIQYNIEYEKHETNYQNFCCNFIP